MATGEGAQAHEATFRRVEVRAPTACLVVRDYAGGGEPVLLLHGGPGCPDYLGPVAKLLLPYHRVLTFDQRGVSSSATLNGRYQVDDYLADIEAIREHLGIERLHVFGHSWDGLLAQLYAHAYPARVRSLFLCNSALGVGEGWQRNQRETRAYNVRQSGVLGTISMESWYGVMFLPGVLGDLGARHIFARVWRNYFRDPAQAPPADPLWLRGVYRQAVVGTERALVATDPSALPQVWPETPWPVLVLYGAYDIFGMGVDLVYARFPTAQRVFLDHAGHVPWIQDPTAFRNALTAFYDGSPQPTDVHR